MTTIAIPFVQVAKDQNPNLKASSDDAALSTYLDAAYVSLASVRRWNAEVDLEFVTNKPPPSSFVKALDSIGATVRISPFRHVPPAGFASAFMGCFYLLDALGSASGMDVNIFIDPDVVCLGSIDEIAARCRDQVGVLRMDYRPDQRVNGLSAEAASEIHLSLDGSHVLPAHFGGELYVMPPSIRREIVARAQQAWRASCAAFAEGKPYFPTEEHILNYAIRSVPHTELNDVAKRVWTAHSYRTVDGKERNLRIWHLPAEKDRGFRKVLGPAMDRESWFWQADESEFLRRMERAFGLRGRSLSRLFLDTAGSVRRKVGTKS